MATDPEAPAVREWIIWDRTTSQWLGRKLETKPGAPDTHVSTARLEEAYRLTEGEAEEWRALDDRYVALLAPEQP